MAVLRVTNLIIITDYIIIAHTLDRGQLVDFFIQVSPRFFDKK